MEREVFQYMGKLVSVPKGDEMAKARVPWLVEAWARAQEQEPDEEPDDQVEETLMQRVMRHEEEAKAKADADAKAKTKAGYLDTMD